MICEKSVSIEHQDKLDLQRHCCKKSHINLVNTKGNQGPINSHFFPQGFNIEKQCSIAEVKVVGSLVEHNLPFGTADQLGPFFKSTLLNSKIAKFYSCGKFKNRAIAPDLQSKLINQIRPLVIS